MIHSMQEMTSLRNECIYELVDEVPESGTWWAVRLIRFSPPGPMCSRTERSDDGSCIAMCVAQRRADGLWMLCTPTPAFKELMCDLLDGADFDWWHYVVERPCYSLVDGE